MKTRYIILILLCIALIWVLPWRFPRRTETVLKEINEINRLVAKELPQGASVSQVKLFLDSHKIGHSGLSGEPQKESDFVRNHKLDGKREHIRGSIVAIKRDVIRGFLTSSSICMYFYFDEYDKLVEYTVEAVGTGP